jgi:hypothetical protein
MQTVIHVRTTSLSNTFDGHEQSQYITHTNHSSGSALIRCHTETDINAQAAAPRIRNHHIRTLNARLARRVPNLLARLALSDTGYSNTSKREIARIHQIRKIIRCERPTSGPEHASKPMVRCRRSIHSVPHRFNQLHNRSRIRLIRPLRRTYFTIRVVRLRTFKPGCVLSWGTADRRLGACLTPFDGAKTSGIRTSSRTRPHSRQGPQSTDTRRQARKKPTRRRNARPSRPAAQGSRPVITRETTQTHPDRRTPGSPQLPTTPQNTCQPSTRTRHLKPGLRPVSA